MSRPSMVIAPDVGSMSRLIIRMVVVLPQPDGPTNTTISPAGMVVEKSSTAGSCCPGYRLVTASSTISAPCRGSSDWGVAVDVSVTDSPRCGEPADEGEDGVQQQRQHDDQHGAG